MKVIESGMPDEELWEMFFKPEDILRKMGVSSKLNDIADFGSGYGTFTIPASRIISGTVYAIDLEKELIESLNGKVKKDSITNVKAILRDIEAEGTGLKSESLDYVMLFNILHGETPKKLLAEAYRILKQDGTVGIIHWNYDPTTPRGPPMEHRLKPEQITILARDVGFKLEKRVNIKPYHYGLIMKK
ncbi:MAG: class I SAM-dependent methyltransferase [Candidatus Altiarchaeota archaeon]